MPRANRAPFLDDSAREISSRVRAIVVHDVHFARGEKHRELKSADLDVFPFVLFEFGQITQRSPRHAAGLDHNRSDAESCYDVSRMSLARSVPSTSIPKAISTAVWPKRTSTPVPETIWSFPLSPAIWSSPAPALMRSAPAPPLMTSALPRERMRSPPVPPKMMSRPVPVRMVSAPSPPKMLVRVRIGPPTDSMIWNRSFPP